MSACGRLLDLVVEPSRFSSHGSRELVDLVAVAWAIGAFDPKRVAFDRDNTPESLRVEQDGRAGPATT